MSASLLSKPVLFKSLFLIWIQALTILRKLSEKVIRKLGMDTLVARPEALILSSLPLPPSGSRVTEVDIGSLLPRTHTVGGHWTRFQICCNSFEGVRRI